MHKPIIIRSLLSALLFASPAINLYAQTKSPTIKTTKASSPKTQNKKIPKRRSPIKTNPKELKHRLHIMYTGAISKTSSVYLISALERLSAIKDNGIKINKVSFAPSIRIKNLCVFSDVEQDLPEKLGNTYSEAIKRFTPLKKVAVLESNFDTLFAASNFDYPLTENLKQSLEKQNRYTTNVRGVTGKISDDEGNSYETVLLEDNKTYSNDTWQAQTTYRYSVNINGIDGEIISFGNFYGGFATLLPMLEQELKRSSNEVLLLETGGAFAEYGSNYANPIFELLQYDAIMPNLYDISTNYDELTKANSKLPLINSNVLNFSSNSTLFKDHIILNKDGVRIAVIGLVSPRDLGKTYIKDSNRLVVKDPIETAQTLLRQISDKVDLKIALVDLNPDELSDLEKISGLNIIIGKKQDDSPPYPEKYMLFKQDKESLLQQPYFLGAVGPKYFSSLKFYFVPSKQGVEERGLFWQRYPLDIYSKKDPILQPLENKSVIASYGDEDPILLPDYRTLFPEREDRDFTYPADEVSMLMANVLLTETDSDVAIYTKRNNLASSVTGEISESMIKAWFSDKNENLLITRMNGATLMDFLGTISEYSADNDPTKPPAVVVGVDPTGMTVKQKAISPSEYYTVVTVRQVFDAVDLYPEFRGLDVSHEKFNLTAQGLKTSPKGKKTKATDVLISYLKREKLSNQKLVQKLSSKGEDTSLVEFKWRNELEKLISDFDIHEGPFYRINLKNIAFEFRGHKVKSSDDYFFVPDARVQPSDETTLSVNVDASFELYGERWNWETGTILDFMDMSITSQGTDLSTVPMDNALLYTDLKYKLFRFSPYFFGRSFGPFINIAYDTQFKPTLGNPRKKQFRVTPGLSFSEGTVLDNVRLGWMLEREYTFSPSKSEQGISFYTDTSFFISKINSSLQSYVDLKYFLDSDTDTDTDLGFELELYLSLKVPIYRSFFIAPYFKYFLFRGKVDPIRKFGNSSTVGVSVGFSEVIKP